MHALISRILLDIAAWALILIGVGWALLCWFAAGMADRQVDTWNEIILPASAGLVPILLGIGILFR